MTNSVLFGTLERLPDDPILGVSARYRADASPDKIDVGVGVYRDEQGQTPVLRAVKLAEARLVEQQQTKAYLPPFGNAAFLDAVGDLVLGPEYVRLRGSRLGLVQAPGGSGALRLGAELIRAARPATRVHVSDPTWGNHRALFEGAGLTVVPHRYLGTADGALDFEAMLDDLDRLPAGDVVLLQGCCHNPTGVDLSNSQWRQLAELLSSRGLLPFVDVAYQGLGVDLDSDAFGVRQLAARLPEVLVAVSCSKNFGLYCERVGALATVSSDARDAAATTSHVLRAARTSYSMAPDHGAAVVGTILQDAELRRCWRLELEAMTGRIRAVREVLATALMRSTGEGRWASIAAGRGMFTRLPLNLQQVEAMRERHHVHLLGDGRINLAGLTPETVPRVAAAVAAVLV